MLENSDKKKIEAYIDGIIREITAELKTYNSRITEEEAVNRVVTITVNKFTPQSKMLLSSVYNMLAENTLKESIFLDMNCKAAFYERNILKDLTSKFSFEVPNKIDYVKTEKAVNELVLGGAVVVTGGVVSISLKSVAPIGVAAVLAVIMVILLKNRRSEAGKNIDALTREYLANVKQSLLAWIDSIVDYYDDCVIELKEGLDK